MVETTRVPSIDYTSRDFASMRQDLIQLIPFFNPEWTDHNASDMGITLVELMSYGMDILHYYVDRMNGESYLGTSVTPAAILALSKQIGYMPLGPEPSRTTLTFTVPTSVTQSGDYIIPIRTIVSTGDVDFETDVGLTIPQGGTVGSVTATEGQTVGLIPPLGEVLGASDGLPFASYSLARGPVISDTIRIYIDEASSNNFTEWRLVDNFVLSNSTDKVFRLLKLSTTTVVIIFGDGINGRIPPTGSEIQAAYRVGGGSHGNVGSGTLTTIVSSMSGGYPVTVTNSESAEGGINGDTISEVKEQAVQNLRASDRAVTLSDYEALAIKNSGIAVAKASFSSQEATTELALSSETGVVTSAIKTEVSDYIGDRDAVGMGLRIINPTLVNIDLITTVTVISTASRATVKSEIEDQLKAYYTIGSGSGKSNFSTDVFESDIFAMIDNVEGVDHVNIPKLTRTPTFNTDNWAATGYSAKASVGPDNEIEQTYIITLPIDVNQSSDVSYTVRGSVTGTESNVGTAVWGDGTGLNGLAFAVGAPKTDVSIELILPQVSDINSGTSVAPQPGDILEIKIGVYRGDQTMSDFEIRRQGTTSLTVTGGVV